MRGVATGVAEINRGSGLGFTTWLFSFLDQASHMEGNSMRPCLGIQEEGNRVAEESWSDMELG